MVNYQGKNHSKIIIIIFLTSQFLDDLNVYKETFDVDFKNIIEKVYTVGVGSYVPDNDVDAHMYVDVKSHCFIANGRGSIRKVS